VPSLPYDIIASFQTEGVLSADFDEATGHQESRIQHGNSIFFESSIKQRLSICRLEPSLGTGSTV
jgi:hypothetical protein